MIKEGIISADKMKAQVLKASAYELFGQHQFYEYCLQYMPEEKTVENAVEHFPVLKDDPSILTLQKLPAPSTIWTSKWDQIRNSLAKDGEVYSFCELYNDYPKTSKVHVENDTYHALIHHDNVSVILPEYLPFPYANLGLLLTERGGWSMEKRARRMRHLNMVVGTEKSGVLEKIRADVHLHLNQGLEFIIGKKPPKNPFQTDFVSSLKEVINHLYKPYAQAIKTGYLFDTTRWIKNHIQEFGEAVHHFKELQPKDTFRNPYFNHFVESGALSLFQEKPMTILSSRKIPEKPKSPAKIKIVGSNPDKVK